MVRSPCALFALTFALAASVSVGKRHARVGAYGPVAKVSGGSDSVALVQKTSALSPGVGLQRKYVPDDPGYDQHNGEYNGYDGRNEEYNGYNGEHEDRGGLGYDENFPNDKDDYVYGQHHGEYRGEDGHRGPPGYGDDAGDEDHYPDYPDHPSYPEYPSQPGYPDYPPDPRYTRPRGRGKGGKGGKGKGGKR